MKFDMSKAWSDAVAMIGGNIGTVAIVAGVFFFLPYLALVLLVPEMGAGTGMGGETQDPDAAVNAMLGLYAQYWWVFALLILLQAIGSLGLMALLTDRNRPTVGEALGVGVKALLPYLGTLVIMVVLVAVVVGVPMGIAAASGSIAIGVLLGLVAFVAYLYLFTKLSLILPALAIDKIYNPIAAVKRSWRLTKGNSLRIFLFYFLLVLAFVVVSIVLMLVIGLVFGLFGTEAALIGNGLVSSLLNAAIVVLFLGILAAIHRQLAGPSAQTVSETFE